MPRHFTPIQEFLQVAVEHKYDYYIGYIPETRTVFYKFFFEEETEQKRENFSVALELIEGKNGTVSFYLCKGDDVSWLIPPANASTFTIYLDKLQTLLVKSLCP